MDINQQTHLWNDIITHHQPPPPPSDQSRHHESSTTSFPPFHHHFPPSSFLSSQAENQERECNEEEEEDEEEELGAMKEMMYRMAAMQSVEIDPASIRKPRRRNVRISDDPQSVAARHRRERISERIRILQRLVPGGTKLDTASMLEEAVRYVKFLKRQIRLLQTTVTADNNGNGIGMPISTPSRIITRSIESGTEGLDGFGAFEIGAVTTGGVQEGVSVISDP